MGSKKSESVKNCVQDWCCSYEPRVLNVGVQIYLLTEVLKIIVSVLFSLLKVLIVLSVVLIDAVIF